MSNELINPKDFQGLADDFWGSSNLDKSDFAIPRVSIGQPTSKKGEPGHFNYNNGTSVRFIKGCKLIVPQKTRVLYGNSASVCKSDNSIEPSSFVREPISKNCMSCYASSWGDDIPEKIELAKKLGVKEGEWNKPLCTETYNLLLADEKWQPFFIAFQKTQIKVVQEKLFSRLKAMRVPPYIVSFDLSLAKITGNNQVYYSAVFEEFKEVSKEEQKIGHDLWAAYSKSAQTILSNQHEAMDQEHRKVESIPTDGAPMPDYDEPLPF